MLENFARHCPVEDATPADYAVRMIQLEGVGTLLAGIHFFDGDISQLFVHATATDFELKPGTIRAVAGLLSPEFAVFRPQRFRIWIDSEQELLTRAPGAEVDQWFLAGHAFVPRGRIVR